MTTTATPSTSPCAPGDRDVRSSLDAALSRIGDRWSLLVIAALLDGPLRFKDLSRTVDGIAPNILTDRLRRLGRSGVIASVPYSARPVRVEYRLTEDGQELGSVLRMLAGWGGADVRGRGPAPRRVRDGAGGTLVLSDVRARGRGRRRQRPRRTLMTRRRRDRDDDRPPGRTFVPLTGRTICGSLRRCTRAACS